MMIPAGSKLLMIGDSITDCGRKRPMAEAIVGGGGIEALGSGYVSLVYALLTATHPMLRIQMVNMGVAGETVRDLAARWSRDVLRLSPDWLSVMIGINDVWRQFDSPWQTELHVLLDKYTQTLEKLVRSTRSQLQGMVLMSPYYIEPDRSDPMRAMMDRYGVEVGEIAGRYGAIFVDTQAAFDRVLNEVHPQSLAPDGVHPNLVGHTILARAFLHAMDFTW